ncbi:hypothetical protein GCM10011506_21770 [Marivirga lumbricoides]|uniref:Uncharacterized protein n=1 Tax=Marivirga lumbricoides TaxID=1046115 RepID=A0ABQ1M7C0_9BACT|nr:hypothetical protein GCM10011506_21770 [Marivirga lumbricoides]
MTVNFKGFSSLRTCYSFDVIGRIYVKQSFNLDTLNVLPELHKNAAVFYTIQKSYVENLAVTGSNKDLQVKQFTPT